MRLSELPQDGNRELCGSRFDRRVAALIIPDARVRHVDERRAQTNSIARASDERSEDHVLRLRLARERGGRVSVRYALDSLDRDRWRYRQERPDAIEVPCEHVDHSFPPEREVALQGIERRDGYHHAL